MSENIDHIVLETMRSLMLISKASNNRGPKRCYDLKDKIDKWIN